MFLEKECPEREIVSKGIIFQCKTMILGDLNNLHEQNNFYGQKEYEKIIIETIEMATVSLFQSRMLCFMVWYSFLVWILKQSTCHMEPC